MVSIGPNFDIKRLKLCIACGNQKPIEELEQSHYSCYCVLCDKKFKVRARFPLPPLMLKCLVCNEDYDVRAEGTRASTCKACTDKENIKRKDYIQEVKNEFLKKDYDDFPKLKAEVEADNGLLTSEEIRLYSNTKQVWWIRVIKWILKFL